MKTRQVTEQPSYVRIFSDPVSSIDAVYSLPCLHQYHLYQEAIIFHSSMSTFGDFARSCELAIPASINSDENTLPERIIFQKYFPLE